jgi:predicted HicB family RNase H-like nuclease
MAKKSWSKGRKEQSCMVRINLEIHKKAKILAESRRMSLKGWISEVLQYEIINPRQSDQKLERIYT